MSFLVRNTDQEKPGIEFSGEQSFNQSLLISLSLVYLAIPNLLFLWGWFTPIISISVSLLVLFVLARAIVHTFSASQPWHAPRKGHFTFLAIGILLATLICMYEICKTGLLGFTPSYGDHYILRHAMFSNLRDAAWPLILPNGKEMTYYLANVLPPALAARIFPTAGQWPVVIWSLIAVLLSLLMLSSRLKPAGNSWGKRLVLTSVFMFIACAPIISVHYNVIWHILNAIHVHTGLDLYDFFPQAFLINMGCPLAGIGGCYNSYPPALLVAALIVTCQKRAHIVLPAALSLLVALTPFGGILFMPFVFLRYYQSARQERVSFRSMLLDALLPICLAFLLAIYFTRADGERGITLTGAIWGWGGFSYYYILLTIGWTMLFLPLLFTVKRNAFFYILLASCLLLPFFYIGSVPDSLPRATANELWLKSSRSQLLLVCFIWLIAWHRIGWYRYVLAALCIAVTCLSLYIGLRDVGSNAYLELDDRWNGHLNHSDPFLNQSVPPCKDPLVPGILLQESGGSELHFPGCLLPKAPGCDYSRPPAATTGITPEKK